MYIPRDQRRVIGRRNGGRGHKVAVQSLGEQVVLAIRGVIQDRGRILQARVDCPLAPCKSQSS